MMRRTAERDDEERNDTDHEKLTAEENAEIKKVFGEIEVVSARIKTDISRIHTEQGQNHILP